MLVTGLLQFHSVCFCLNGLRVKLAGSDWSGSSEAVVSGLWSTLLQLRCLAPGVILRSARTTASTYHTHTGGPSRSLPNIPPISVGTTCQRFIPFASGTLAGDMHIHTGSSYLDWAGDGPISSSGFNVSRDEKRHVWVVTSKQYSTFLRFW
jgi:hypothetical protein